MPGEILFGVQEFLLLPILFGVKGASTAPIVFGVKQNSIDPPENAVAAHIGGGVVQINVTPPDSGTLDHYEVQVAEAIDGPYYQFSNFMFEDRTGYIYNFPLSSIVYIRIRSVSKDGSTSTWLQVKHGTPDIIKVSMELSCIAGSVIPQGARFCVLKGNRILAFDSDEEVTF